MLSQRQTRLPDWLGRCNIFVISCIHGFIALLCQNYIILNSSNMSFSNIFFIRNDKYCGNNLKVGKWCVDKSVVCD